MANPPYGSHLTTIGFNTSTEACRSSQCLDCSLEGAIRFQVLDEIQSLEEDSIQWRTTTSTWTLSASLWVITTIAGMPVDLGLPSGINYNDLMLRDLVIRLARNRPIEASACPSCSRAASTCPPFKRSSASNTASVCFMSSSVTGILEAVH